MGLRALALTILFAVQAGCYAPHPPAPSSSASSLAHFCESVGICDPASLPSEDDVVLDDPTLGSSGTPEHLTLVLEAVLTRIAERPGSTLSVWMLTDPPSVAPLVVIQSPAVVPRSPKAVEAWVKQQLGAVLPKITLGGTVPTRSPIADALTRVAQSMRGKGVRRIIVVSDMRDNVAADLECSEPSEKAFLKALRERASLPSGSLDGITVEFVYAIMTPLRRCALPLLPHELLVRARWQKAIAAADGTAAFSSNGPLFP